MFKRWKYGVNESPVNSEDIERSFNVGPLFSAVCASLGLGKDEVRDFVEGDEEIDPFMLPQIDLAIERIDRAIISGEKIAVYGDYDADGVTATAILCSYLKSMGAEVFFYIPKRLTEGYGMNKEAIDFLKNEGTDLIITVDNGISCAEEIAYARELGIDTVVTDHHKVPDVFPDEAVAVVNPQREDCDCFKELCGAGVALMLVAALEGGEVQDVLEQYADIAAIGTIADVVPVLASNRVILKKGLELIKRRTNPGIASLLELCYKGGDINAQTIAFSVVPRINASGRMGDASPATELLMAEDEEEAIRLSQHLLECNIKRQETEAVILSSAKEIIEKEELYKKEVIVVANKDWHHGVLGIVAAKVCETYGKPAILLSIEGDEAKGSSRSPSGFPLFEAIKYCEEFLLKYGGHSLAAGLSLKADNIELFYKKICEFTKNCGSMIDIPSLEVCADVSIGDITVGNVKELDMLAPFGQGNPQPVFVLKNVYISAVSEVGGGKHTRIKLSSPRGEIWAVYFGKNKFKLPVMAGSYADIAATLEISTYQGTESVSVKIRDIRPVAFSEDVYAQSMGLIEKIEASKALNDNEKAAVIPQREDFAAVYKFIASHGDYFEPEDLIILNVKNMSPAKLFVCLKAMKELMLIKEEKDGDGTKISIIPRTEKVNLFDAPIFKRI